MGLPDEQLIDVTELQAAIAALNGCEPPSGRAVVSAAVLSPISARVKKEEDAAAAEKEANPEIGDQMQDGSVYAGLTADGKRQIFAMPEDFDMTLTFNEAAKQVAKLNAGQALTHDDWEIPKLEYLQALRDNQNKGKFKDSFKVAAANRHNLLDCYWSSGTYGDPLTPVINFSGDEPGLVDKDSLDVNCNCRLVRLVPVASSPA